MLGVHSHVFTYVLQTIVEQAIALLEKLLQSQSQEIAPAVRQFPVHLRFGVPTEAGCILAAGGIHHRRAFVALGNAPELRGLRANDRSAIFVAARQLVEQDRIGWQSRLGALVFKNTLRDLSAFVPNDI
jgi:helicase